MNNTLASLYFVWIILLIAHLRGTGHHCAESVPSGFCWLNNVHIAIAHAARAHDLTHAVILDIDLHHGDGSQAITWTLNDMLANSSAKRPPSSPIPKIAYLSLHDINSYPCEAGDIDKIKNASLNLEAHNQFIMNMHLQKYATTNEFWDLYEKYYSQLLSRAKDFLVNSMETWQASKAGKAGRVPRAAVFISAGFDASEHEMAGMQRHKVHVPTGFYARFAREAVMIAEDEDTGCSGRVISVLEGGYSNRAITSGVLAHLVGLAYETPARAMFRHHHDYLNHMSETLSEEFLPTPPEMEYETFHGTPRDYLGGQTEGYTVDYYDPAWWDIDHLVELENKQAKRPKKSPAAPQVNYLSATVSSAAKMESKSQRALAAQQQKQFGPPAPPVVLDWATATVELSKKLIPQDPEEEIHHSPPSPTGSVMSTRSVSKRHSHAGHGDEAVTGTRMTLRERKPKTVVEERAQSRAAGTRAADGRRKSVAGVVSTPATPAATPYAREGGGKRAAGVPAMQRIPSRATSPAPAPQPGTRRVVSVGMPPPSQRSASVAARLGGRGLEKAPSVGNIRAVAGKSAASTPSPPPSAANTTMGPPPPRGLRRVNSTSTMTTAAAQKGGKRPSAAVSNTSKQSNAPFSPPNQPSTPPLASPLQEETEGDEDAIVSGLRRIMGIWAVYKSRRSSWDSS